MRRCGLVRSPLVEPAPSPINKSPLQYVYNIRRIFGVQWSVHGQWNGARICHGRTGCWFDSREVPTAPPIDGETSNGSFIIERHLASRLERWHLQPGLSPHPRYTDDLGWYHNLPPAMDGITTTLRDFRARSTSTKVVRRIVGGRTGC